MIFTTLRMVRARRWIRHWLADVWRESKAPLTDANARLNYIAVAALLLLLLPKRGPERMFGQAISALDAIEAFLYAFPASVLLNCVLGVFRVLKQEGERGAWFGPKYVYHEPMHVATILIESAKPAGPYDLTIADVEDASLVSYRVDIDRQDERVKAQLEFPGCPPKFNWAVVSRATRTSARLPKSRKMSLATFAEPEATATTIRVYVLGFEIGKG